MSKSNNLHDYLKDLADAIRTKVGTTDKINPQEFSNKIKSIRTTSSGNGDGGHVTLVFNEDSGTGSGKIINEAFLPYVSKMVINGDEVTPVSEFYSEERVSVVTIYFAKKLTSLDNMFFECYNPYMILASGLRTDKVTSMFNTFNYCSNAFLIDVSGWDTSRVTNMSWMFGQCVNLQLIVGIETFDTYNVTDMTYMFNNMKTLPILDLSRWDCSNVISMQAMFGESDFVTIKLPKKVEKVENIFQLFILNPNLREADMRGWNMSNLKSASQAFNTCSSIESIWMDGPVAADVDAEFFFFSVPDTGTFHHNPEYDYSAFTTYLPSSWEFDPYMPSPGNLIVYYDVTSTTSDTSICYTTTGFKDIKVDGESIGLTKSYKFNKTGVQAVEFITADDHTMDIAQNSFYNIKDIVKVSIPGTIFIVYENAFNGCTKLTEVSGLDHVLHFGAQAFMNTGISTLKLSDILSILGMAAFKGTNIEYVEMPANTMSVAQDKIFSDSKLKTIVCRAETAPTIPSDVFQGIPTGGTLYVPEGADYSSWMSEDAYYLGYYNWTVKPLSELPN